MAEISKLSGVAIADVAKVDAILKASIANINDLTIPADGFLLDTYTGAAAAYSVRRLNSLYTGACMRVRRDSDNTEQDIGFDANGDLDTAAIATFVGSGNNGYVRTWYGQEASGGTGSGDDMEQATAGSQPLIYNGTAVITENGKPTVDFISTSSRSLNGPTLNNNSIMGFCVAREVVRRGTIWGLGNPNFRTLDVQYFDNDMLVVFKGDGSSYDAAISPTLNQDNAQHLITVSRFSNALKTYVDGTADINVTDTFSANSGALGFANRNTQGQLYLQEAVFWSTDQTSNQTGIESNINNYFSIY